MAPSASRPRGIAGLLVLAACYAGECLARACARLRFPRRPERVRWAKARKSGEEGTGLLLPSSAPRTACPRPRPQGGSTARRTAEHHLPAAVPWRPLRSINGSAALAVKRGKREAPILAAQRAPRPMGVPTRPALNAPRARPCAAATRRSVGRSLGRLRPVCRTRAPC